MSLSRRSPDNSHLSLSGERANHSLQIGDQYVVRDNTSWPIARAYLIGKRILPQMVDSLSEAGMIYADAQRPEPNLVFLHRNARRKILGASVCSISDDPAPISCRGSKDTAWFYIGDLVNAHTVAAVESPIDALSFYCLRGSPDIAVVSCTKAVAPDELMLQAYERKQAFVVAFNNTAAGEHGWQKAWDDTADWTGFKISSDCPALKDWNADLIHNLEQHKARSIKI